MSWRDKVQAMREGVNCQNTPSPLLTQPTEPGCVSFGSTSPPPISKNQGAANDPAQVPDLVAGAAVALLNTWESAVREEQVRSEVRTETPVSAGKVSTLVSTETPLTLDPDRWCWPRSSAMNTAEIDTFTARLHQFTRRGLAEPDAESLADKLMTRDREADDRRLCMECLHLKSGAGRWGCNQWQRARLGAADVPAELVRQLQRCDSFTKATS